MVFEKSKFQTQGLLKSAGAQHIRCKENSQISEHQAIYVEDNVCLQHR